MAQERAARLCEAVNSDNFEDAQLIGRGFFRAFESLPPGLQALSRRCPTWLGDPVYLAQPSSIKLHLPSRRAIALPPLFDDRKPWKPLAHVPTLLFRTFCMSRPCRWKWRWQLVPSRDLFSPHRPKRRAFLRSALQGSCGRASIKRDGAPLR